MPYNLANIKPSDIYSLTEDTDRALCQSHPETDWPDLLVALHCTGCGNFTEWICSKTNYVRLCQFVWCVLEGGGGGGIRWWTFFIFLFIYSGIFENVIAKWTFRVQQFLFFGQKLSPRVPPLFFFSLLLLSFSSLFLFLLSFSYVTVILEILGVKKPVFWSLFIQMTANFVRLVFKKSARYVYKKNIQLVITVFKQHHAYGCLFNSVGGRASETTLEAVKIIFHT